MCDSMALVLPLAKINEIDTLMNDKIDLYNKVNDF